MCSFRQWDIVIRAGMQILSSSGCLSCISEVIGAVYDLPHCSVFMDVSLSLVMYTLCHTINLNTKTSDL